MYKYSRRGWKEKQQIKVVVQLELKGNVVSFWFIQSSGYESHPDLHMLLACQDPCSLCLPSDQQHSHPLVLCAGSSLCESVYFRVCDSHFLCSTNRQSCMEQQDLHSFSILSFSLCFSLSLSLVASLIGLAWVLRNAGACMSRYHFGIHLQMQKSRRNWKI